MTLGASVAALGAAQLWELSLARFNTLGQFSLQANAVACGAALNACDRGQSWESALALLLAAQHHAAELGAVEFNSAITCCSSSYVNDHALATARTMIHSRVTPDLVTCNALLAVCARAGMWYEAVCILRRTPILSIRLPPMMPDVLSYSAALAACSKGSRPYEALTLLSDARCLRIPLDLQANTNAVSAFHQANLWQQALAIAQDTPMDAVLLEVALSASEVGSSSMSAILLLGTAGSTAESAMRLLLN